MRREKFSLKPQDILVLLKLIANEERSFRTVDLAYELDISQSEISEGLERLRFAHLIDSTKKKPHRGAALELLSYGLRYFFPVAPGPIVTGVPTASSTLPLSKSLVAGNQEKYVWPYAEGDVRGQAIEPLYKSAPMAALRDSSLYQLLSIVDSIRIGRAREYKVACEALKKRLLSKNKDEEKRARRSEMY